MVFATGASSSYCKAKNAELAAAATARNKDIARINKARAKGNVKRARMKKPLPMLMFVTAKIVTKMPLVELIARTLQKDTEMALWPVARFMMATYQVQSMTQAQIEAMFSHLKRLVSKHRHALKQANQDRAMAILENGPDGPACKTSGHVYTHEEFFRTALQIWTQTKARKIVTAYNEEDWLQAESYEKEWGANMRSSPEGQKLQKECLQRQVHKFNLLRTKRDKDKVQQDLLEFECTSTFADRNGAVTTTTRRAVKDLDGGQPQVACCVLWMHFSLL